MPGPVCPTQGPRGLWAGAYGAIPVGSVEEVGKSTGPDLAGAQATRHWKIKRAWAWQEAPGARERRRSCSSGAPGESAAMTHPHTCRLSAPRAAT